MADANRPPFHFLNLPTEIRGDILSKLVFGPPCHKKHCSCRRLRWSRFPRGLLLVNKQMRSETLALLSREAVLFLGMSFAPARHSKNGEAFITDVRPKNWTEWPTNLETFRRWPLLHAVQNFHLEIPWHWDFEGWDPYAYHEPELKLHSMRLDGCKEIAKFLKEMPRINHLFIDIGVNHEARLNELMAPLLEIRSVGTAVCSLRNARGFNHKFKSREDDDFDSSSEESNHDAESESQTQSEAKHGFSATKGNRSETSKESASVPVEDLRRWEAILESSSGNQTLDTCSPGEVSLAKLLSSLRLSIHPETFVFITYPSSSSGPPPTLFQQMSFREKEGLTVITTLHSARRHRQDYTFPSRMITCEIHSSLDAVGFMAVLSRELTKKGIGVNPVSGFYHDHLFVPCGKADEAIQALERLAEQARISAQD